MSLTAKPEGESVAIIDFKNEVESMSMSELLKLAEAPERMLDAPFEVEGLIGSLALMLTDNEENNQQLLDAIKVKVDNSYRMIEALDAFAAHQEIRAQRYLDRAKSAKNRSKSIMTYFTSQMKYHGISELRGIDYKAVEKFASNPSLVTSREPDAEDFLLFPEYVREVPARYEWNANPIKETLKPFHAELKAGKDIKDLVIPFAHDFATLTYSSKIVFDDNYQAPPKKVRKKK